MPVPIDMVECVLCLGLTKIDSSKNWPEYNKEHFVCFWCELQRGAWEIEDEESKS